MSETPYTDSELSRVLAIASTELRSRKPLSLAVVALLNTELPRLVAELRWTRKEADGLDAAGAAGVEALTQHATELQQQLAARDAQIARMRLVIEGAEVANA